MQEDDTVILRIIRRLSVCACQRKHKSGRVYGCAIYTKKYSQMHKVTLDF